MDRANALQLVLLSIIIVCSNKAAAASDKRADDTHRDADATLHEAFEIQNDLVAQAATLKDMTNTMRKLTEQMTSPVSAGRRCERLLRTNRGARSEAW